MSSTSTTADEAYGLLAEHASKLWGEASLPSLEQKLRQIAAAMEVLSRIDVPEDVSPFGEKQFGPSALGGDTDD